MKVLLSSVPATGHVNPIFVAGCILRDAGHDVAIYTGIPFRDQIEEAGLTFFPLPPDADESVRNIMDAALRKRNLTPNSGKPSDSFKTAVLAPMRSQFLGLQAILRDFPADVVIHETAFAGVLPMLLGPRSKRPASVYLGITPLPLDRADGAPWGPGLPPTDDPDRRREYAEIARNIEETSQLPLQRVADDFLSQMGLPGSPGWLFKATAVLADLILQPCTPSFEFPLQKTEDKLHFIGALQPTGKGDVPTEIKEAKTGGRKIILVSQGTFANHDLGKLLAPAIIALGDREDILLLATTGGAPIDNIIPCALKPNTIVSQYFDFSQILEDVDVLIAFGSYGTATQALKFGVPMVLAGKGQDKPEVGARVHSTGAGIYLATDDPTPDQLRNAVDEILMSPDYRARGRELATDFSAYDASRRLPQLIERLFFDRHKLS